MSEFVTRCFTPNLVLCPEKCTPSRADKAVLFDYVVYVPNVIKVTSIARSGGCVSFRFLLTLECRLLNGEGLRQDRGVGRRKRGERQEEKRIEVSDSTLWGPRGRA